MMSSAYIFCIMSGLLLGLLQLLRTDTMMEFMGLFEFPYPDLKSVIFASRPILFLLLLFPTVSYIFFNLPWALFVRCGSSCSEPVVIDFSMWSALCFLLAVLAGEMISKYITTHVRENTYKVD